MSGNLPFFVRAIAVIVFALPFITSCKEEVIVLESIHTIRYTDSKIPTDSMLLTVDFVNDQTGFIGTADGKVFKTTNQAASWSLMWTLPSARINKLLFQSATLGFACTSQGLYRTTNGGTSWSEVDDEIYHDIAFSSNQNIAAVGPNTTFGFSSNGGSSWTQVSPPAAFKEVQALAFDGTDGVALGQNSLHYSSSSGSSWSEDFSGFANDSDLKDVIHVSGHWIAVGNHGYVYQMKDETFGWYFYDHGQGYQLNAIDETDDVLAIVGENTVMIGGILENQLKLEHYYAPDGTTIQHQYQSVAFCTPNIFFAVGENGIISKFKL